MGTGRELTKDWLMTVTAENARDLLHRLVRLSVGRGLLSKIHTSYNNIHFPILTNELNGREIETGQPGELFQSNQPSS